MQRTIQHLLGLDLGKQGDPTALTVLEREEMEGRPEALYDLRNAFRWPLGTRYQQIVEEVVAITERPELIEPVLVVDQTGVGQPIVELFELAVKCVMRPITITAGHTVTPHGMAFNVPKIDIVACLVKLFGWRRLRIAKELALAATIAKELENFRLKLTKAGNETFEAWRESDHDDLVLSAGIAAWVGENCYCGDIPEQPAAARSMMSKLAAELEPGMFGADLDDDDPRRGDIGSGTWGGGGGMPWR